jgi:hypothetical protein
LQCKGASFGGGLHHLGLETSITSVFAPLKIGSGITFAIRVVFFFLMTIYCCDRSKNLTSQIPLKKTYWSKKMSILLNISLL